MNPRILFVSTYPSTGCGIATFIQSLVDAIVLIRGDSRSIGVFRILPPGDDSVCLESEVVAEVCPDGRIDPAVVPWHHYDLFVDSARVWHLRTRGWPGGGWPM